MRSVLVVAPLEAARRRVAGWLEDAGLDVMVCPGPRVPDGCILQWGDGCPLEADAEAIVVDGSGTERELGPVVEAYLERGHSVVMLGGRLGRSDSTGGSGDRVIPAARRRRAVLRAVARAIRTRAT